MTPVMSHYCYHAVKLLTIDWRQAIALYIAYTTQKQDAQLSLEWAYCTAYIRIKASVRISVA